MRNIAVILALIFIPFTIFAGGQAQSGRDTNTDTIQIGRQ
jgi:hypothetical protein